MFYVCKYGQFLWERVNAGFSLASGFVTPIPIFFDRTGGETRFSICGMVTMNASGAALKLKG